MAHAGVDAHARSRARVCVRDCRLYGRALDRTCMHPPVRPAAGPEPARALYESLLARLRSDLGEERVAAGVFGAMMACSFENDGPVTMVLDSDAK
mmetsp:Transcript_11831/g.49852  ORF Transcript_11831/g.49852 Transcript_11831/m.49852 type:complete len:95 (+) Transcript_11831:488-772(+)